MTEPYQPPVVPGMGDAPTSDDKLWALLAYIFSPIVPIILMLMEDKKNRPFIKANNFQALAAGVALWVVVLIVGIIPVVQCVSPIVGLVGWIYMIYLGIQAYNGNTPVIPFVSDFVKQQGWGG